MCKVAPASTWLRWSILKPWLFPLVLLTGALEVCATQVTFRVNLEVLSAAGSFNPGAGDVAEVRGSFNAWSEPVALAASVLDPNIYEGRLEIVGAPGTTVEYKFSISQGGTVTWERDGVGPIGAQNRNLTLTAEPQVLPTVFFNNEAAPPDDVEVTFQVNLTIQAAIGRFDASVGHSVELRGTFNNWGGGTVLTEDPERPGIYQATVTINGVLGAPFEYKFVINPAGGGLRWEDNVGPGGPNGNRTGFGRKSRDRKVSGASRLISQLKASARRPISDWWGPDPSCP